MAATFHAVQCDGEPADARALAPLAFAGYAHFTAMQVRGGRVRGLDLHLDRLRHASQTMFGQVLPDERIRALLRSAMNEGPADVSLVATVYGAAGEFTAAGQVPHVLVRTAAPSSGPAGPLALAVFEHERMLPHIKHVGEVAKTHFLREAARQGYDDAAFMDRQGRLSEASIWNLAFRDGDTVVWPQAPMLAGITMQVVRRRLAELGIAQRSQVVTLDDVARFTGAAVMNSWTPGVAVNGIGTVRLADSAALVALLHQAYALEPLAAP